MDQCKEGDDTWTVDLLPEATPKLIVWHKHFVSASNNLTRNFLIVSPKLDSSSMMAWRCGFFLNTNERSAGYYYNTSCSKHIANGDSVER
ncbi:hypothetical protein V1520DRAFT_357530 [Lipomyces starkeyi]